MMSIRELAKIARSEGLEPNFRRFLRFRRTGPNEFFELRALGIRSRLVDVRGTGVAYLADWERAVELLQQADDTFNSQGIYITQNRINPAIACRLPPDRWSSALEGDTTKDKEITQRAILYFDLDPDRPKGISTTTDEVRDALRLAFVVYDALASIVPSSCIGLGLSGNGTQIHLALDVANTQEMEDLCRSILCAGSALWGSESIHVDTSVGNAARICPAFGSRKRKGFSHPERPHRRTWFACEDEVTHLDEVALWGLLQGLQALMTDDQTKVFQDQLTKLRKGQIQPQSQSQSPSQSQTIWKEINRQPIAEVARRLGLDTEHPQCLWCGASGDSSVKILTEYNRLKCLHSTCGSKSASPLDLIAKVVANVDSIKGDANARTKVLDWVKGNLGIETEQPKSKPKKAWEVGLQSLQRVSCDNDNWMGDDPGEDPGEDTEETPSYPITLTDAENARRFIQRHGADLRFVASWQKWLVWSGSHWVVDDTAAVMRLALDTAYSILAEAAAESDPQNRALLAAHAHKSLSLSSLKAMVTLAQSDASVAITFEDLNPDPWKLNCLNGTIDLRTGELHPPDRNDLCTKVCPVVYDPKATAPLWTNFLEQVQPDPEVRSYLARRIGYAATALVRDHVLWVDYGPGGNGKGTFDHTVHRILGPYAVDLPSRVLMVQRNEAHPTTLTTLFGARYASSSEVTQGSQFNVELVNRLTGNDPITAHRMHENDWTFNPTHKLAIALNHRPRIRDNSNGIWRRVHLIPWMVTIPPEAQDKELEGKLAEEMSGILTWIVQGCLEWRLKGLAPPESITAATAAYRDDEDILGQFLSDCTEPAPGERVAREALRRRYEDWAREAGDTHIMGARSFVEALRDHGLSECPKWKCNGKTYRGWADIRLQSSTTLDDDDDTLDQYLDPDSNSDSISEPDYPFAVSLCDDSQNRKGYPQ